MQLTWRCLEAEPGERPTSHEMPELLRQSSQIYLVLYIHTFHGSGEARGTGPGPGAAGAGGLGERKWKASQDLHTGQVVVVTHPSQP